MTALVDLVTSNLHLQGNILSTFGHIVFGADPVRVGILVSSSNSLDNTETQHLQSNPRIIECMCVYITCKDTLLNQGREICFL